MLPVTRKSIPRRTFLRGTGAALALPVLDAMTPAFASATTRPIRLGFVEVPNGIMMDKFTPATEGPDFALTPVLEPLAEFRDRMSVLSGLNQGQAKGLSFEVGGAKRSMKPLHTVPATLSARPSFPCGRRNSEIGTGRPKR